MDQTVDIARRFGNFIAAARVRQRMSQIELAERADVSQAHLSKIENGQREPTISIAMRLCSALGLDINEFKNNL